MHSSLAARTKIADARTWKDPLSNIDEISDDRNAELNLIVEV